MTTSATESSPKHRLRLDPEDAARLWQDARGATQGLGRRWISAGILTTGVFWLMLNMLAGFSSHALARSSLALGTVIVYSVVVFLVERRSRPGPGVGGGTIATLAKVEHSCALLFVVSAFSLGMGLVVSPSLGAGVPALGIALTSLYLLNCVAAMFWAPRSMVLTSAQRAKAQERQVRWLPYAIGCQGLVVGIGVFLSAMLIQGLIPWGQLLILGLSILLSLITLTLAIASFYRVLVLTASPL